MTNPFKYLYGPVYSWRLGRSLGIDPLSQAQKICNMSCVYCQLGLTSHLSEIRKEYVPTNEILDEIKRLPAHQVDYLTFSGRGEPTLASNLGEMIREIKKIRHERVAVITNSSLLSLKEVQEDLASVDFVLAKLDAANASSFHTVAGGKLNFEVILQGIQGFRQMFKGKFALQIMLIDENMDNVADLANIARELNPDEVQLNTPLRPCGVKPIESVEMHWAKKFFNGIPVVTVWDAPATPCEAFDDQATIKRHGNYFKKDYGS